MQNKPRLLDLCCGGGGAGKGYADAGFEVTGIDLQPQSHYPFHFALGNALTWDLNGYDAYHVSPPCQFFTSMLNNNKHARAKHHDLIQPFRARLQATGKPYVIENVPAAPLHNTLLLCGAMFGLRVYRHRHFESNVFLFRPPHPKHQARAARPSKIPAPGEMWCPVGKFGQKDDAQRAMGIDWMDTSRDSPAIAQAIPPAYTEWIGRQLLCYV